MSVDASQATGSSERRQRIREVVAEVLRRRSEGAELAESEVLRRHPELMPELGMELGKLSRIRDALECAARESSAERAARALDRILRDSSTGPGSGKDDAGDVASDPDPVDPDRTTRLDAQRDALPERVGRYRVQRRLGSGGFGHVYLATDEELHRLVAVKVPHRDMVSDHQRVDAYLSEARMLASLDHPAIVPVFDVGRTDDGSCYVVSKWIPGSDLAARIGESRLSPNEAARIVRSIAEALHHAHAHGIVHRDIKPANILLDGEDRPYLADFGLALRDDGVGEYSRRAGTPRYMSPEQARGESHRVDGRSDLFSLGVVLYEVLAGCRPFRAGGLDELLAQIIRSEPVALRELDPSIPAELERICFKCLAKRATDRYARAADLADDLGLFLEGRAAPASAVTATDTAVAAAEPVDPASPRVVPKGLRAFDAGDASFFLDLLPGPRDRDGLPDSIRTWKHRIEARHADESFPVGVLYGPSGCGKSSFVRAGLLPRLGTSVVWLYLEATPDDFEERLRLLLVRRLPELDRERGLAACLTQIRRGAVLAPGQKLLLVIDQFEQWLQGKEPQQYDLLVEALRQCDGQRLQCLILVRDDFWLGLSRFLADLEIDLIQGKNSALVDLFDLPHARKVLLAFGRAFGRLGEESAGLSVPEMAFVEQALHGLSEEGRLIPVRLAVFAELFKSRPWTPQALQEVGGVAGVGVTFLDETFCARAADARYRRHEPAVRAVLAALLPASGSAIKGHMRSYPELLDLSGYGFQPRAFKELMRILDAETRLLTPTDPATGEPADGTAAAGQRYYQLSHDYLVPSVREWLSRRQRASRRGRAELLLAERAAMWSMRPERRQLPSLAEWMTIGLLTERQNWSAAQRAMMRSAVRHQLGIAGLLVLALLVFLIVGNEAGTWASQAGLGLRARTAPLWLMLGQEQAIWPLLQQSPNPTLRTQLIHELHPLAISPQELVERAGQGGDPSLRRAMLLAAGSMLPDAEGSANRAADYRPKLDLEFRRRLLELYEVDPDPGIHAAAEWILRPRDDQRDWVRAAERVAAVGTAVMRPWYITPSGHSMVVIPGPTLFDMGSPAGEPGRGADESLHQQLVGRSFSLAAMETTAAQFRRFLADTDPGSSHAVARGTNSLDEPAVGVTWYQAAAYCNWLSEKEGIPREQWCYAPNADGAFAAGMIVPVDAMHRHGYRLPTEAEWEYACRAGTLSPWSCGERPELLPHYAVFQGSRLAGLAPAGSRKPNDFGLFDMSGNAAEWCQDAYQREAGTPRRAGADPGTISDMVPRVIRGGSYRDPATALRSAARHRELPGVASPPNGFRVARSFP